MRFILTLLMIGLTAFSFAADRYWIAGAASNWNNTANWSTTSGGAGGASVPVATDRAIFDANGLGNCNVDISPTIGGILINGYTAIIELNGNFLTISSGNAQFTSGSLIDSPSLGGLNIATTGTTTFNGTTIGAITTCSSARLLLSGSTFNSTGSFTKTGANNDQGAGGNTFNQDVVIANTGSGYLMTANGTPDVFTGNVTVNNSGTNLIYFCYNSVGNTIAGNLDLTNSSTATGIRVCNQTNSDLAITGNCNFSITGSADGTSYFGNNGDITLTGNLVYSNTSTAATTDFRIANGTNSAVTINGSASITNSGTGVTTQRAWVGENGDVTFNSTLALVNTATANNSEIFLNRSANSTNTYNDNITLDSNGAGCDGIRFGQNNGSSTLAATRTITVAGGGFSAGTLYLRNFTQTGATAQSMTLTGTGVITIYDSNWGGNVDFTSPRITTRGTVYSGTCDFEKTGANNDNSVGGNTFSGNATFVNSGSGEMGMGNGTADTYGADVDITNSGTSNFRLAYNSAGNTVAGNITALNTGTANNLYLSSAVASTLVVTGNVSITDNSSDADHDDYVGNNGDVTIGGDLTIANNSPGDRCDILVANGTDSQVMVGGTTTVTNAGTGATVSRVWLGNQGDITFNGNLTITNSTASTNSQVFCNYNANSTNIYNGNIIVNATNAASDGVRFGENGGAGTLNAGFTVTIGGGGFVAGDLRFRNFTQAGGTAQALSCSGTARIYNYDSNWGGNVDFDAPRMLTRGTTYNGTADLEKTGGIGDDASAGGNTFVGNCTIRNSGSSYFMMGNGTADDYQSDLDIINNGTDEIYIAHNSAGNTIGGNLTADMNGAGALRIEIADNANSTLTVTGTATFTNSSTAPTNQMIIGDNGDIDFDNTVSITTTSGGTNSYVYFANGTNCAVSVDGTFTFTHSSTATNNVRSYVGNNGDITFNNVVTLNNNTSATNSDIYVNHNANSNNQFNHNIVVTNTNAAGDGVRFGQAGGAATLAATRTVTIGGGGFVAGELRFRNFTQVGPTAQALTATGTAYIYNIDSDWGGNVDFQAPRMRTDGTTYNGTADLDKTGGIADDQSAGGNTFVGDATLTNSGSNYFMMGNGNPDDFQSNLTMICNGSDEMYLAHNSAGNTIAGTFSGTISNTGTRIEVCDNANSTLTITGVATIDNNSTAATTVILLGDDGDIDFDNALTINNGGATTTSRVTMAQDVTSAISIDGAFTFNHTSTATNDTRAYIGSNGDITFNGITTLVNSTSATNSQIYCNLNPNSNNSYNENIIVSVTDPACDGIRFGESAGFGTLAATKTVTIGVGGFVAGDLRFRNFTQVGPTAQALTCSGTARIYNYDSNWGGDVNFVAPRMITRGTTYNGTSYLEKSGAGNDGSVGGNLFVGNSELRHSGTNQFLMGNGTADVWQTNLEVNNSGGGNMYVAYNGLGHSVAGTFDWTRSGTALNDYVASQATSDFTVTGNSTFTNTSGGAGSIYIGNSGDVTFDGTVTVVNTPSVAGTGQTIFGQNTDAVVIFNDVVDVTNNGTATTSNVYIGNNGDITINANIDLTNTGSGTTSQVFIANGTNCTAVINGNTTFDQSGNITTTRGWLGANGDITFNGTLDISNNAQSNNSEVFLNYNTNSSNVYNGNITATSENASCDGVRFGQNGGFGSLSNTFTVTAGGAGFVAGDFRFRNFTQVGATVQNIVLTGTARIYMQSSTWNANLTGTAPRLFTRETTYNGTADLTKNGASNDHSTGGNIFNMPATITNSGTGRLRFSGTNGFPDDYNARVTFIKTGTGALQPSYNNTDTYADDININTNTQIYFGNGGNGRVLMDGAGGDQDINDLGASPTPLFRDLQVNKAAGEVHCNTPVEITVELDLDNGVVNTTTANLMTMRDNSIVSSVSDASHIDGPIEKIGNDVFTFPTGDSAVYRPISISAPTSGAARFRAEYFKVDPHPTYDHLALDVGLDHISSCEYWTLDRIASTNNVSVTLSWDWPTSCEVNLLADLRVARWDGTLWADEGNGGTTGAVSPASGTVVSGAAVTNFSPFTLASISNFNPLPVELIEYTATYEEPVVKLNWSTASETDCERYEIERSRDGINWEYFETVAGAGTVSSTQYYDLIDPKPYAGKNYYRLTQYDTNGEFEELGIRVVEVPNDVNNLTVYPNPTEGEIYVISDGSNADNITIYNALGQEIFPAIEIMDGQLRIDLSSYENGIFIIKTEYAVCRVIKQ